MTNATEKKLAELRRDLEALRAEVERMPGYEKSELAELEAPIEVAQIEIGAKVLNSVRAMTEKDAQQIIAQTKSVKINVAGKTTLEKVTPEKQKITVPVPVPTNLGEGQLVVIELINKDGGKFTLAYVKTNAQGRNFELRGAAEQKRFRQQEDQQEDQQKGKRYGQSANSPTA